MIDYQHKSHTLHRSSSQPSEMHLQHVNSDIVFTFECSNRAISFVNKDNPLHPLLWDIFLSAYLLAVHFISLRRITFPHKGNTDSPRPAPI